ncbi:5-oxoprolinase subunit B family protein [Profundibacterium mesophilum]|uniref:Urea carboxylase n=1 Tax=Profundibacterium mesophilum KAUST100406-0324 TaxID=1037889 RepID=A0A921NSG0_9RHOB|nr:carboxyltransferase domain-containing protein [Profundibacterium mesophilum]KAF0674560.1 urea carboxylase [Profundibacterium mesophilum KAUST100406-0324]
MTRRPETQSQRPDDPLFDVPQIAALGIDGLLVRFRAGESMEANRAALALRAALEADPITGVQETSGALASVYLRFDPAMDVREAILSALRERLAAADWARAPLPQGRRLWHVPASFEGGDAPDLGAIADAAGIAPEEAVAQICAAPVRALALGFAPGQAYFGMLPARWDIPRRAALVPAVPRGAIVLAVRQLIVFAATAPTGWHQIGRSAFQPFRPSRGDETFAFRAGDELRLHPVGGAELREIEADDPGGMGGARAEPIA